MVAWNVYIGRKWIDTVYYRPNVTQAEVLKGLINHDGYNPSIRIRREK